MADTNSQGGMGIPSGSHRVLFWASFLTLIAAGIGFSVRGAILKDWGQQYGFTQTELGAITGGGLAGFGITIIVLSFFADRIGYGKLMLLAFVLHFSSAIVTFAATFAFQQYGKEGAFWCLNIGMWLFALGNGTCEAVINPLTASLYPNEKTHKLNILHAGWPAGLIIGALVVLGFKQVGDGSPIRWEYKLAIFLVPTLLYGILMFNRFFPKSEANESGVSVKSMMKQVGFLGFAVACGLVGLLLSKVLPDNFAGDNADMKKTLSTVGWGAAVAIWAIYTIVCGFSPGSIIIAILYVLHALVGYVELGTDSWITNITETVLKDESKALYAFIWTNALMCFLRFFAGPIVHKISPVGLLFFSATLGCAGLYMLGQNFTNDVWPWLAAVTVYGIGKTFYWPTLLGVISERFPKGGALALGISGGIGMLAAGLIGGPGIGYKQDYFAVEKLEQTQEGKQTHERYKTLDDEGKEKKEGFPLVSKFAADKVPLIAGLDNGKLKVSDDYGGVLKAKDAGKKEPSMTTLEADLEQIAKNKEKNIKVEEKLEKNLNAQKKWWDEQGKPNHEADSKLLGEARLYGGKQALLYTAAVPAVLAIGFLLLILIFKAMGGYKQVHIGDEQK